jgi:Domain of unknown function (DUF4105)
MSLRILMLFLAMSALDTGAVGPRPARAQDTPAERDAAVAASPVGEPGSELRVWLITAGPGDAVWERYGHNALRVLDTISGRDVAYNWGIFDFQQVDFIPRFLQGRMLYMMAPFQTQPMIDAYARADREVVLQELNLTPAQKLELRDFADRNALPENREYTYQYFLDNCSTRIRDLLDLVLDGALRSQFELQPSGTSYRYQTRRLTQLDPLIYTGMDLLLGTPTDQPLSVWEEMFLPMTLRDQLREVTVAGQGGTTLPLVMSDQVVVTSSRPPDPTEPPRWFAIYLLLGLILGAVMASSATEPVRSTTVLRRTVAAVAVLWSALGGVVGTILVLLLFTDHTFSYWNENLFLFNPLMLVVAALIPLAGLGERWCAWLLTVVAIVAGIAVLGLLWQLFPGSRHQNATFFALALPAHLGLAYASAQLLGRGIRSERVATE